MQVKRTKLLAGNWKMHKLNQDLSPYFSALAAALGLSEGQRLPPTVEVLLALPATLLAAAEKPCAAHGFKLAAQNVHWEPSGAFTGELSLAMIAEVGAVASLIGHSERRQYFAETDVTVVKKTQAALNFGISPIVCVGESLAERDSGASADVVSRQVEAVLAAVTDTAAVAAKSGQQRAELIFAYEPVWAIGTGRSATTEQAQEMHALIRRLVRSRLGDAVAASQRILYGGSANPANIVELLAQPDVDGGLVGGASLKPDDFAKMVRAAF